MPGRRIRPQPNEPGRCRRCQTEEASITVRNEPLCSACFRRYVSTKVVKRMELYFRVRDSTPGHEKRLLLPLSLGYCSIVLLQVLSTHLKGQLSNTGRTGYKVHVLHVADNKDAAESVWSEVQRQYPEHEYSISALGDSISPDDGVSLLPAGAAGLPTATIDSSDRISQLQRALKSLTSPTSRADVLHILRQRQIVRFAKTNQCDAILWGHSTTRLAERTLAETAKGRGHALPWIVGDGDSPSGIPFYYPLRELLSTEIKSYTTMAEPSLDRLVVRDDAGPALSAKNTTIDELMRQYFATVERDYPSIVANVVRTTGKLQAPSLDQVEKHCELCDLPLDGQSPERSRLCYGCIRTLPSTPG